MILKKLSRLLGIFHVFIKFMFHKYFDKTFPKKLDFPLFNSILVRKLDGKLNFIELINYESRNQSTINLIRKANDKYLIEDFDWVLVCTDDNEPKGNFPIPVLSYSVKFNNFKQGCPDFLFEHWKETGISSYTKLTERLMKFIQPPKHKILGWRGAPTHQSRRIFAEKFHTNHNCDVELIKWKKSSTGKIYASNFISIEDQQKKWRYHIDIEGRGFSARLKLLFFLNRVVFIQDRDEKEWYFEHLKPWIHYVPVSRDFSDFNENLNKVINSPSLEKKIINNARNFALKYLTQDSALLRWSQILKDFQR